jgi:receptor-type tyrosine-protein phosphatase gamma
MKVINFVKFTFLYIFINKCEGKNISNIHQRYFKRAYISGNPEESNGFLPSPGRPLVMSFNSRSVNLSWTPPPPFNDGPELPLTDYSIHVRRGENSSWLDSKKLLTNNTGTTYTVQHLRPFTVYSFKVGAVFGNLTSDESSESYYMITLREVPSGTPTITVAHNTSSTSIYLAWEPPHTLTINGEFLGYKLSYESRSSNRSGKFSRTIKNPTIREFILRDLNIFTQYSISLQVLNPEGAGPATKVVVMTDEGG